MDQLQAQVQNMHLVNSGTMFGMGSVGGNNNPFQFNAQNPQIYGANPQQFQNNKSINPKTGKE